MNIKKVFDIIQKIVLILFVLLIIVSSISALKIQYNGAEEIKYMKVTASCILLVIISLFLILSKISSKEKIFLFFLIGFALRIVWLLSIPTQIVSDYKTIYDTAVEFLNGNMKELTNFGYLARFPHLIPMMLYMASVIFLFPTSNLIVMKIVSLILSMITMFLILKLSDFFVKGERGKSVIVCFSALNVAFISYVSTYCTENIAIPLFLFTILIFLKTLKLEKKQIVGIIFAGIMLSISNLFRAVGIIFLIAFVLYLFFYTDKNKYKNILVLIISYLTMNILISFSLIGLNIIETPLWKGSEPKITSVLKGTNISSYGMWNIEDAEFISNNLENSNLSKLCTEKIKMRLNNLSIKEFVIFYCSKFVLQWYLVDNAGIFWAMYDLTSTSYCILVFRIIGIINMILSLCSIVRKRNNEMKLLHIILIGIMCLFLTIEAQSRYSYIISWVFIFMSATEFENILDKIEMKKRKLICKKNDYV